jgi:hypothetical protein
MAKRVIALRGVPYYNEESKAAAAITPGQVVNFDASANLVPHATAAVAAAMTVAMDRFEMGKDIDSVYAINDTVKVGHFHAGQRFLGWLAAGNNLAKGALLEMAGAGAFRALASGVPVARMGEAINAVALSRATIEPL